MMKRYLLVIALFPLLAAPCPGDPREARTLGYEGEKLYRQGDFRRAARKWERGLALSREAGDNSRVAYFLANLGVVYADLGDHKKAVSSDEEALRLSNLLGDKTAKASILGNLGNIHRNQGEYDKALAAYEDTLKLFTEDRNDQGMGTVLGNMGNVYSDLADYKKALEYFDRSFDACRKAQDKNGIATALGNKGIVYKNLGQYHQAIAEYEEALKIFKENRIAQGIAATLTNLGIVSTDLGDYRKAISLFDESMMMGKLMGDQTCVANDLGNMGVVYRNLGEYDTAVSYLERSLAYFKGTLFRQKMLENYLALGAVYRDAGDGARAAALYAEALAAFKSADYRQGVAQSLVNLAALAAEAGEYDKALSHCDEALRIVKAPGPQRQKLEAAVADVRLAAGDRAAARQAYLRLEDPVRLGRLCLAEKDYPGAAGYFEAALKDDLRNREAKYLFADYCGLGHAYASQRQYEKARENYEKAVLLAEEQRESLGKGDKIRFFAAKMEGFARGEPYEGLARVMVSAGDLNKAFYYSECLKARSLSESIARGETAGKLPDGLAEQEEGFIIRIRNLRKEMEALYRNRSMDDYGDREKELKEVKAEFDDWIGTLRRRRPEYAAVRYPRPLSAKNVALARDEALLAFEVTDEKTYLFLLKGRDRSTTVRVIPKSRAALQEMVGAYRSYFEGIEKAADLARYDPLAGRELYAALFGDILNGLDEGTTLVIVPDEFLGILSFESLVVSTPLLENRGEGRFGPFPLGVTYLGDRFPLTYAQSATSLMLLRSLAHDAGGGGSVLAVCDPVFSAKDGRSFPAGGKEAGPSLKRMGALRAWNTMGIAGVREKDETGARPREYEGEFPRLEKTREIARHMQELFGGDAVALSGPDAREENVVQLPLERFRYVVFGTHGILDDAIPWIRQPALVLTLVGNRPEYDGFLTMSDVMNLKIPAEVVALTACETGVGRNVSGEGVMGMGRAFQFAGSKDILMSLWPAAEDATVALTNAFFDGLKAGKKPLAALREARSAIRKIGYEHPFYWSAFILVSR